MKINIYKENLHITFTSLPIDKTCCLGLIERKPETDSSQYRKGREPVPVHHSISSKTKKEPKQPELIMISDMREFMHFLFAEDIVDWKHNKNRSGVSNRNPIFNNPAPPPPHL